MSELAKLNDDDLGKIARRARKNFIERIGPKGLVFLQHNGEMLEHLVKAVWIAIREYVDEKDIRTEKRDD